MSASAALALDLILKNACPLNVEFDDITIFEIRAELKAAAVADRDRADEFARRRFLSPGDVSYDFLKQNSMPEIPR